MKKVVLLNSSFVTKRKDMVQNTKPHLRIGIANLAACLLKDDIEVVILDPQLEKWKIDELVDNVAEEQADVLGLPAYTEEIYDAHNIASKVKERDPGLLTVLGGHQITALPKETMAECPAVDVGVVGEGETAFRHIVAGKDLSEINGIVYRENEKNIIVNPPPVDYESLDDLPFPAWHLYDLKRYHDEMPIEPLRGCPYDCVFCFRSLGTRVRYKSPQRILDEIEYNINVLGCRKFAFKCGTFPLAKKHAREVFNGILERGLKFSWVASTRIDVLDEEIIQLMKDTGCVDVSLGIESGDAEMLKQCGKNTTPEKAETALKLFKKAGMKSVEMNFILGLPGETKESLLRTKRFALKMAPYSSRVNFAILTAFPATRVYEMALCNEAGLSLKSTDWRDYGKQAGLSLRHANFDDKELVKFQLNCYLSYYLRSPRKIIKLFSIDRFVGLLKKFLV
ncbi:MAG: B12-binding domain-containing radical SAM protein [Candidatus Omnitrophota bacterium]